MVHHPSAAGMTSELAYRTKSGRMYAGQAEDVLASPAFGRLRGQVQLVFTSPPFPLNRKKAYGMRLDIPAGTAVRFEPGQSRTVTLVAYGGAGIVHGFRGDVNGRLKSPKRGK